MRKLYDEDSSISNFTAFVTGCEQCGNSYRITLDATAFFPTAGGQSCDTGVLDGQRVLNAEIQNDIIYHTVEKPIQVGKCVEASIDFMPRFRKMQHHTAEHIVSGLIHKEFGFDNVGFHLSDKEVTMDYSGEISEQQLCELEQSANLEVYKNSEVKAYYPHKEELSAMSYRCKTEILGDVRIVKIGDVDTCACCAPHVKRTGEIGIIKFKDMMRHRNGVRIRMICGLDAVLDYQKRQQSAEVISKLLSVKQEEIADGTQKLHLENAALKQKISDLFKQVIYGKLEKIEEKNGNICIFEENIDKEALRFFAIEGKSKASGVFAVFTGDDFSGYSYFISGRCDDFHDYVQKMNNALSGRGGGKGDMVSGHLNAKRAEIESYLLN